MIVILLNFGVNIYFYFMSNVATSVPKFRKFLGDVETRRVVSRISSSHVTWQAGDITIPFIFPLMPTVTHTFPQSRYFSENCGRRFAKLFPRARTDIQHKHTLKLSSIAMYLARRAWLIPTVVQSSASSGKVVSPATATYTTYPELRL